MIITECGTFWEVLFRNQKSFEAIGVLLKEQGFREKSFLLFSHPHQAGKVAVFFKDVDLSASRLIQVFSEI